MPWELELELKLLELELLELKLLELELLQLQLQAQSQLGLVPSPAR